MPQWTLDAADGKTIYGLLKQPISGKSDKAVLIVPGMTGTPKDMPYDAAAVYFAQLGYDVLSPYLYDLSNSRKNARKFHEVTIPIHAADIDTVMDHFAPHYKAIYGVGHSYGAPCLLLSDTSRYKAIALWDPSFKQKAGPSKAFEQLEDGSYVISWDHSIKPGQAFVDENTALDRAYFITLAKNCKAPVRVVLAGDGDYIQQGESYHSFAKTAADMKIVKGTKHRFIEPGTTEPLLQYTREWFDKLPS